MLDGTVVSWIHTMNGTVISWVSQLQQTIPLSTIEVEYVGIAEGNDLLARLLHQI